MNPVKPGHPAASMKIFGYNNCDLHKCNQEGDQGGPWTPLEGAKLHQKVQKWVLEGAEIKDFERLNTSAMHSGAVKHGRVGF